MISATPQTMTSAKNPLTGIFEDSYVDQTAVKGVLYNRSAAERYFSQTWAQDVSDVFVCGADSGITGTGRLVYDGTTYECEEPVNEGNQGEVYTVALRVHK
jgi:hypothetical protein